MSAHLKSLATELDHMGQQAQALASSVHSAVGGSATGVDRDLVGALQAAAKSMRKAALGIHSAVGGAR